mgnify:CR=1 FL=1
MAEGFLKLMRSEQTRELQKNPKAFTLLSIIAYRARRTNGTLNVHNLKIGEALIGDCENYGLTEQEYRTSKTNLKKWDLATFKSTTKGTIAKLTDNSIFDINSEGEEEASTDKVTNKPTDELTDEQRTNNGQTNGQRTTNKNGKNDKNDKNERKRERERAPSGFEKPTAEEVKAYASEIGYDTLNSETFVDYYAANGWRVGKNPMKDWRATVRNWKARDEKQAGETLSEQFARLEKEGQP